MARWLGEQRIEALDVLIECLTQAVSRRQPRPFHSLRDEIGFMGEDVEQILWEQIPAESHRLCYTDELSSAFCPHFRIICVPLKEAEDGISLQGIQDKEC